MKDNNNHFSDFENVRLPYRRSLIPWWIWLIQALVLLFNLFLLSEAVIELFSEKAFTYSIHGLYLLLPYPYYPLAALLLFFMGVTTAITLWQEKTNAIHLARLYSFSGILACVAFFVVSIVTTHSVMGSVRIELVFFTDLFFRMKDIKKVWLYKSVSHKD